MAEFHQAVADGVAVRRNLVLPGHVDLAGFHRHAVVPHRKAAADDIHPVAALRVDTVGVGAVLGGGDKAVQHSKVPGIEGVDMPGWAVFHRHAVHSHVLGVVEKHHPGPLGGEAVKIPPPIPVPAVSVDGPPAHNGDILRVGRLEQRLVAVQLLALEARLEGLLPGHRVGAHAGDDGVALPVCGAQQRQTAAHPRSRPLSRW